MAMPRSACLRPSAAAPCWPRAGIIVITATPSIITGVTRRRDDAQRRRLEPDRNDRRHRSALAVALDQSGYRPRAGHRLDVSRGQVYGDGAVRPQRHGGGAQDIAARHPAYLEPGP